MFLWDYNDMLSTQLLFTNSNNKTPAGAGQRVFLWDYDDMLSTTPDSLEPVSELCCRLKLASVSFSKHERSLLAAG